MQATADTILEDFAGFFDGVEVTGNDEELDKRRAEFKKIWRAYQQHDACPGSPLFERYIPPGSRHCANCYKFLVPGDFRTCAKCHKRAFCGRECQLEDWKAKGKAQGHKNWCGLDYGEEDLDWEIFFSLDRGMGLRAKRTIPPHFRIIVEGFDRSIDQKDIEGHLAACKKLRRSLLANHECDANADRYPVVSCGLDVFVMYSQRTIQAGEEICVNYSHFNDSRSRKKLIGYKTNNVETCRELLKNKWGITCPPDCFCRRSDIGVLVKETRLLDTGLPEPKLIKCKKDAIKSLEVVKKVLRNFEVIHASPMCKTDVQIVGFDIAVQQNATLDLAMEFAAQVWKLYSSVAHDQFWLTQQAAKFMKNPEFHPLHLKLEK